MTAQSLLGEWGKEVQRFSAELLEEGLVHIMGSDAHDAEYRPPKLREALLLAAELIGEEAARALVDGVPRRILQGKPIISAIPLSGVGRRKPSLWKRIFGAP